MAKEVKRWKLVTFYGITLLLLSTFAMGVFHTVGRIPTLLTAKEVNEAMMLRPIASDLEWVKGPEFLQSFQFINENTEKNDPIFNWWGIGNWLTFFTEHPVVTDPTNAVGKANEFVASMMLSDWNTAYKKIKERGFKYVYWIRDYIYASDSFALYAYGYKDMKRAIREASKYTFFITEDCKPVKDTNYYNCGTKRNPFFVDSEIVNSAPPVFYAPISFDRLPKIRGTYGVYRLGNRLVIVSKQMNDSLMFLLWKGGNDRFVPIFISEKGLITIYKIN